MDTQVPILMLDWNDSYSRALQRLSSARMEFTALAMPPHMTGGKRNIRQVKKSLGFRCLVDEWDDQEFRRHFHMNRSECAFCPTS